MTVWGLRPWCFGENKQNRSTLLSPHGTTGATTTTNLDAINLAAAAAAASKRKMVLTRTYAHTQTRARKRTIARWGGGRSDASKSEKTIVVQWPLLLRLSFYSGSFALASGLMD